MKRRSMLLAAALGGWLLAACSVDQPSLVATAIASEATVDTGKAKPKPHRTTRSGTKVRRDKQGRILRSSTARCRFLRSKGYADCHAPRGYVVDHVVPLACGGADSPGNMQLQTKAAAKAKDRWERKGCQK